MKNLVKCFPKRVSFFSILYDQVLEDPGSVRGSIRKRLTGDDPDLTRDERLAIRQFLEACPEDED